MDSKNYTDKKYSLSDEGETPKQYGNFNTYAKDVILQRDTAHTSSEQTAKERPSVNNKKEEIHHEVVENKINRCRRCGCEIFNEDILCIHCYRKKVAKTFAIFFALWISTAIITAILTGTAITFGIWWFWFMLFPFLIKKDNYITKRRLYGSKPYSVKEIVDEIYGDPEIADVCRRVCNVPAWQKINKPHLTDYVRKRVFRRLKRPKSNIVADYNKTEESTVQFSELTRSNHVSYKISFITSAVILIVMIVILAIGTILSVEHRKEIMLSEAAYTELEKKYDVLNNKFVDLFKRNEELQKKYNKIIDEYEFYKQYAVCINENDPYYHTYTCKHFDISKFLIYNIDKAKEQGYEPCPDCRLTE